MTTYKINGVNPSAALRFCVDKLNKEQLDYCKERTK